MPKGSRGGKNSIQNALAGNRIDLEYARMKAKEYGNIRYGGTTRTRNLFEQWNDEVRRLEQERITLEKKIKESETINYA